MTNAQSLFETAHKLMQASDGGEALTQAAAAMRKAADAGHAGAANNYGAMLQYGRGVAEDLFAARDYYARAAEAGLAIGQFNLGFMWLHGLGGAQDTAQARALFELAGAQDEPDALTHLGAMCMTGEGGPQDFQAAFQHWARGAVEAEDHRCAFNLGIAAGGGHGAPPDFAACYAWFTIAHELGSSDAMAEREKVTRVMNEAEIVDARARTSHIRANCSSLR